MPFLRSITLQHLLLFTNQDVLWIPLVTVFNGSFKIWVWLVKSLVSSVQFLSRVCLYVIPWITACQAFLSITNSWSLLKLMSITWVMPSGILKNLLQHHSSKTSIFQCSVFFIVQFSHPYMTTGNSSSESKRGFYSPGISRLQVCFASQIQSP